MIKNYIPINSNKKSNYFLYFISNLYWFSLKKCKNEKIKCLNMQFYKIRSYKYIFYNKNIA